MADRLNYTPTTLATSSGIPTNIEFNSQRSIIRIIEQLKKEPYTIRYKINILYDLLIPYIDIRIKNLKITDLTLSKFNKLSYDLNKMIALCSLLNYEDEVDIPKYYTTLFNILLHKINIINELRRSNYNKKTYILQLSQITEYQKDIINKTLPDTEKLNKLYNQILISLYSIWYDANKIYNITIIINDEFQQIYNDIIDTEFPSQKIAYIEFINSGVDITTYTSEGVALRKLKEPGLHTQRIKIKK